MNHSPPPTRLLIVDDEAAQMQALRETLREQGYDAVGCVSGEAGLELLRQEKFDILLADLMMPGMDGIALLRSALRIDPTLVAIIMTGAGTIGSAVEAMQSGALDYILKPFKLSAIVPVLARALAMHRLRVANAELERRIRERSAELEAANIELEAFSRSVSHDLRTPLNAVIGFTELVSTQYGEHLPPQGRGWLAEVGRAAIRMNELIRDLLRLSQLGRQALELEAVDLNLLTQSVADDLRQDALHAKLRVDTLPQITADASLLKQVFANLMSNAFKFTRRTAQAVVCIGCEQRGDEQVFFVRDNGEGFEMAKAARLFGAFERLHEPKDFEGTGVGLTIVQRIVQRHGGRIWAEAEPGNGATFYFTLSDDPAMPAALEPPN